MYYLIVKRAFIHQNPGMGITDKLQLSY